ncbi:MAG: heat shock protein HspQ [Thermodesulfobacteriota bacterium]|nr:heat shock protein HspQ [Thermodesulfobacteriota bacterium]
MQEDSHAKFRLGQIVEHKLFGYTGVVYDIDPDYQGTDEWYESVAKTKPPKDKPWYHLLVNEEDYTTYVAERNLIILKEPQPIKHPLISIVFDDFDGEAYKLKINSN